MKNIVYLLFSLLFFYSLVNGQSEVDAIALSHEGKYAEAEELFLWLDKHLENDGSVKSIARAYNFSWWGKYEQADTIFKRLLVQEKNDIDALIGLAYNTSWKGERDMAVQYFQKVITLDPQNRSAWLGLAYNYLEKGNLDGAASSIYKMEDKFKEDAEIYQIKGLLAIKRLENSKAKKAFKTALKIDPSLKIAREKLAQFDAIPTKWALSLWHGSTMSGNSPLHSFRRFDFTFIPMPKILLYGGYDNTLVLQNTFLRISEIQAPLFFLGSKYNFSEKFSSKFELGRRTFSNTSSQTIISSENTYFIHHNFIVSAHLFYDIRSSENLLTGGLSLDVGFSPHFRTMVSYFHHRSLQANSALSQRILLSPKLFVGRSELNLGLFYDLITYNEQSSAAAKGYFGLLSIPIIEKMDGKLLYHQDINPDGTFSTLFSLGITIKL